MMKLGASWKIRGIEIPNNSKVPLIYVEYFFSLQKTKKQAMMKILDTPKNTFSP